MLIIADHLLSAERLFCVDLAEAILCQFLPRLDLPYLWRISGAFCVPCDLHFLGHLHANHYRSFALYGSLQINCLWADLAEANPCRFLPWVNLRDLQGSSGASSCRPDDLHFNICLLQIVADYWPLSRSCWSDSLRILAMRCPSMCPTRDLRSLWEKAHV